MKFSERIGKKNPKVNVQIDYMDHDLKNGLWNAVCLYVIEPMKKKDRLRESIFETFVKSIWFSFLKEPLDTIPSSTDSVAKRLREYFFYWDYLQIYDFIDFIVSDNYTPFNKNDFINFCNLILKREVSGYRFVNDQLAPITNEEEKSEIERALAKTKDAGLKGVYMHLHDALKKLSDKKSPDYRNSIKESISAVESLCQAITNDPKAELGKALKLIKSKLSIHSALEQGFIKIYSYTSDSDGIRHGMLDEPNLDQEDAIYMLISCSAFINYLIIKLNKSGIQIK